MPNLPLSIKDSICCLKRQITDLRSQVGGEILSEDAYAVFGENAIPEADPEAQAALREALKALGPVGTPTIALDTWYDKGQGKITFVGDSTIVQYGTLNQLAPFLLPGKPLDGSTATYLGYNGQTTMSIIANNGPAILAENPDIYVITGGINNVRTGAASLPVFRQQLIDYVQYIRNGRPGTPILLLMPNSFLSADVGGNGYVVPNANAQSYSNILRDAYRSVENYWPDVYMLDAQELLWGETSLASSSSMSDQIHPSNSGYGDLNSLLVSTLGHPVVMAKALATAARTDAPTFPSGLYAPALLDPDEYELIGWGNGGSSGSYYEIGFDKLYDRPRRGDIIWNHGNTPFVSTVAPSFQAYTGRLVYRWLSQTPPAWTQGNATEVYRPKYYYNADIRSALMQNPARKLWVRIGTAGSGFLDVSAADAGLNASAAGGISEINTGDTLAIQGYGNLALTGATFTAQSVNSVRINITGTWTPYSNQNALLYNTAAPGGKKTRRVRSGVLVTAPTVVQANDDVIECDTTGQAVNLNLPIVANVPGMVLTAKKVAGANALQFVGNGADLIDGAATLAVATFATIRANTAGTAWHQIG